MPLEASKNKEVAEALGLCWHEPNRPAKYEEIWICKHCGVNILDLPSMQNSDKQCVWINPDFTTDAGTVQLLRLMMGHPQWTQFCYETGFVLVQLNTAINLKHYSISIDYITTKGKLREAVWLWLKEKER